jgi:hypothetical protein
VGREPIEVLLLDGDPGAQIGDQGHVGRVGGALFGEMFGLFEERGEDAIRLGFGSGGAVKDRVV